MKNDAYQLPSNLNTVQACLKHFGEAELMLIIRKGYYQQQYRKARNGNNAETLEAVRELAKSNPEFAKLLQTAKAKATR